MIGVFKNSKLGFNNDNNTFNKNEADQTPTACCLRFCVTKMVKEK